jgi:hypothetical protein
VERLQARLWPDGDPKIIVINAPSRRMNPLLSATVVQRAYERDPQAAASEFGGQFRNDISGFLDFALSTRRSTVALVRPPRRAWTIARPATLLAGRMTASRWRWL